MVESTTTTSSSSTTSSPTKTAAVNQNGVDSSKGAVPKCKTNEQQNNLPTLPKGKYTLVGIDIDTTGRRLIDEIVQLAAFTTNDHFEQYIMPYMNLNPAARQRHQVRVISIGFYRMLKSTQTFKIIKSKSEIAALKDFLDWLEALKAKDTSSQGIILVYHEERKFIPYMILESLKKYNLLDRFQNTVKSFANGLNLAKSNVNEALQHYTLRKLSKYLKDHKNANIEQNNNNVLTSSANTTATTEVNETSNANEQQKKSFKSANNNERELFDGNASVRAKLAYEIALHLSNQDSIESLESPKAFDKMLNALQPYAQPIECDLNELQTQNENLERQNSFRPVFLNYFKTTLYHRVRAVKFRIILAENSYDLQTLNAIWSEKKRDGLLEILEPIEGLKAEDKTELADLFDSYFDPAKTTIKPVVKTNNRRRNRRIRNNNVRNHNVINEQGASGDKQQQVGNNAVNIPDSTTKSPKNQRGRRQQRSYNNNNNNNNQKNLLKTQTSVANDQTATPTATNNITPATAPTATAVTASN